MNPAPATRFPLPAPALLAALLTLVLAGACSQLPDDVLPYGDEQLTDDPGALAERARADFAARPRRTATVLRALDAMQTAAIATPRGKFDERFERLRDAARYAIWLARFSDEGDRVRADYARRAHLLANTLAQHAADRVEGVYLRAIAAGLWADNDEGYGLDAMSSIEDDARRARELDPSYDEAGPHRLLGALYLRAPAPPVGPGSKRRAVRELERAVEIAPDSAGNLVWLSTAYLERGKTEAAAQTMTRAEAALAALDDGHERAYWTRLLRDLR